MCMMRLLKKILHVLLIDQGVSLLTAAAVLGEQMARAHVFLRTYLEKIHVKKVPTWHQPSNIPDRPLFTSVCTYFSASPGRKE